MENSIFNIEDFEGSGQYVILNREDYFKDTGYMTTLLFKICYNSGICLLVAMTDGMVMREFKGNNLKESKHLLCEYLATENYRFATHEELVRMALHQHRRCRPLQALSKAKPQKP
jgi:hypothetical protein